MKPHVIKKKEDYKKTLADVERLIALDPQRETPDGETLELLSLLVATYERENFPFGLPDPVEAIAFCMEEQGLRQIDLVPLMGSRSRVSEILARKRPLTLPMVRALNEGLGIPLEVLVQPIQPHQGKKPQKAPGRRQAAP